MTYNELFSDAKMECGINVPQLWLTPSFGLLWITEARHLYQAEIGVRKCTDTIMLSNVSTDGKYNLSNSVGSIEEITLAPDATTQAYQQIVRLPIDGFHQIIETWPDQNPLSDNWTPNNFLDTNLTYCAVDGCSLYIYPYPTPGVVTIRYKPLLPPYSASDTSDWAGWGNDPAAKMKLYGPGNDFIPAITGIKAYVKMKITEMRPNGLDEYAKQYQIWNQTFEKGKTLLRRKNVGYQQDMVQPTSMGGLI